MKRLVSVLLGSAILLMSLNVFANRTIEKAEFTETNIYFKAWDNNYSDSLHANGDEIIAHRIELGESLLSAQLANDETTHFIHYQELPKLLNQLNFWTDIITYWNAETNTIEILDQNFLEFQQQLERIQVIELIDLSSINPDEWIDISFFSTLNNGYEYTSSILRNNSNDASITIQQHTIDFTESYDLISSIVNCNTANVRVVEVNHSYEVNIQDLKNNNIFSDEEISEILNIRKVYGTVEEYNAIMHFNSFKEIVNSGSLSDDELSEIITRLELLALNSGEVFQ